MDLNIIPFLSIESLFLRSYRYQITYLIDEEEIIIKSNDNVKVSDDAEKMLREV